MASATVRANAQADEAARLTRQLAAAMAENAALKRQQAAQQGAVVLAMSLLRRARDACGPRGGEMRLGAVRLGGEFILGVHDAPSEPRHAHAVHSAPTAGLGVNRARSRRSGSSIPSRSIRVADVGEHAADRGPVPRIRLDQPPRAMRAR